jgi:hypothetical protein
MRMFYSILLFIGVALNISAFLFVTFHVDPTFKASIELSTNTFNLDVFSLAFTSLGAAGIMIMGLLLRQGTYAIYATLIWVVTTLLGVARNFITAIPNVIFGIFGPALAPIDPNYNPANINLTANPIIAVLVYVVTFAGFWFFMEIIAQRAFS